MLSGSSDTSLYSFGHAFGWISSYLVEYLITKECYNYFYFGNCGAIGAKLKVGDIAYPNQILKLSEENNEKIYNQPFINLFQNVNEQIFHVSVDSPIVETKTMQEAVETAVQSAQSGDNVVLSPACSSYDMFTDFEERGRVFKQLVNAL